MAILADKVHFKGRHCFRDDWVGFDEIKPINVIIGRNNSGKSHLLDLVELLCSKPIRNPGWRLKFRTVLQESLIQRRFQKGSSGGKLPGNHWRYGAQLVDRPITWEVNESQQIILSSFNFEGEFPFPEEIQNVCRDIIIGSLDDIESSFSGKSFRRLLADRDLQSEPVSTQLTLGHNGTGATNIIRRFITTSNVNYPRELIQVKLLEGLKTIFGTDGRFTEIQVKHHDEGKERQDHWEAFLGEIDKGLIPLSDSGSGLKTILLVLLNLLVIPVIEGRSKDSYIFAFEELENNLHPALLRRLLQYIQQYVELENAIVFLTTHSSTALDFFCRTENAQIIHVKHSGVSASVNAITAEFDHLGIISELGARPSDLLQANGIIWMEGPSDCIYLNQWLNLISNGDLQEGRDYQCAFYGGSLLARIQFTSEEAAEAELVNLLRINPNIVIVCDSDRTTPKARLKPRVRRIEEEVAKIPGAFMWTTKAREIENYLPGSVLAKVLKRDELPDPGQCDAFFPRKEERKRSYIEKHFKCRSIDKTALAIGCAKFMSIDEMKGRFDWERQMLGIAEKVRAWKR